MGSLDFPRLLLGPLRGPAADPDLGEIVAVLTGADAIAADSPLPGQLGMLCRRLGVAGPGIAGAASADLPVQWASVPAQRDAGAPAGGQERFAPLAAVLPVIHGTRFALCGLSSAAGVSHLHVACSPAPEPASRRDIGSPGGSGTARGNWHVAAAGAPDIFPPGMAVFRLRLTPLAAVPAAAEVVVTGPAVRVRVTVPVRAVQEAGED